MSLHICFWRYCTTKWLRSDSWYGDFITTNGGRAIDHTWRLWQGCVNSAHCVGHDVQNGMGSAVQLSRIDQSSLSQNDEESNWCGSTMAQLVQICLHLTQLQKAIAWRTGFVEVHGLAASGIANSPKIKHKLLRTTVAQTQLHLCGRLPSPFSSLLPIHSNDNINHFPDLVNSSRWTKKKAAALEELEHKNLKSSTSGSANHIKISWRNKVNLDEWAASFLSFTCSSFVFMRILCSAKRSQKVLGLFPVKLKVSWLLVHLSNFILCSSTRLHLASNPRHLPLMSKGIRRTFIKSVHQLPRKFNFDGEFSLG